MDAYCHSKITFLIHWQIREFKVLGRAKRQSRAQGSKFKLSNHNAKLRLFFHPAAACPESRNFAFLPVVTKFSSSWLQNSGPLREVLTFGRHCSRSAMLAVAFLGRDSAITKQAQMALSVWRRLTLSSSDATRPSLSKLRWRSLLPRFKQARFCSRLIAVLTVTSKPTKLPAFFF